jgi:hypothetical protein
VPSHIILKKVLSNNFLIYIYSGCIKPELWKNPENNLVTKVNILHYTNIVLAIHSCTK